MTKEPSGLVISGSGKRPDGVTLIPWKNGKYVAWDVTIATTLAESYLSASSSLSGSAAEMIAARKVVKYRGLPTHYNFIPLAFESWVIASLRRQVRAGKACFCGKGSLFASRDLTRFYCINLLCLLSLSRASDGFGFHVFIH